MLTIRISISASLFRNMSLLIAAALNTTMQNHEQRKDVLNSINLPDFVKQNTHARLKAYLIAISLNGFSKKKIRKLIVLGNKGNIEFLITPYADYFSMTLVFEYLFTFYK